MYIDLPLPCEGRAAVSQVKHIKISKKRKYSSKETIWKIMEKRTVANTNITINEVKKTTRNSEKNTPVGELLKFILIRETKLCSSTG